MLPNQFSVALLPVLSIFQKVARLERLAIALNRPYNNEESALSTAKKVNVYQDRCEIHPPG
ncbi:hypothetical protein NEOLI_005064 [Neolecta irregularis DAH-3]|uniref:Uncharacterized protein n=1 Tax=Neolecta irregularis (strain DAH-3) TaxID=1198029 RepID=A0A1U7LRF5_NEOID|nr:hypothetical protein NEOLI_005064 [Neolecta irregularis DAH-3]|eukprot:OLL25101.1 hypothetical protein NEOLI_005064 [Neolecta irregularis DAH-3]